MTFIYNVPVKLNIPNVAFRSGSVTKIPYGTPTQDSLGEETTNINAHYVEDVTVRYGTITQDSISGSTPEKVVAAG